MENNKKQKLPAIIAERKVAEATYNKALEEYTIFFAKNQGAFKGRRNTYQPKDGTTDFPTKRGVTLITTTVWKKLDFFVDRAIPAYETALCVENTNASSNKRVEVICDGKSFGFGTALELLRWKGLLEGKLEAMLEVIPVRSDAEQWSVSNDETFKERGVYESPKIETTNATTENEEYYPLNPNVQYLKEGVHYDAKPSVKSTRVELGIGTTQEFTGEATHVERVGMKTRLKALILAIEKARIEANDVDAISTQLAITESFEYIFGSK